MRVSHQGWTLICRLVEHHIRIVSLIIGVTWLLLVATPAAAGCSYATWMQSLPDTPGDYCCRFATTSPLGATLEVSSVDQCLAQARIGVDQYVYAFNGGTCPYYETIMYTDYPPQFVMGVLVDYGSADFIYSCPGGGYIHMDPEWYGIKCQLVIKSPLADTQQAFDQNDFTATNITYEADDPNSTSQVNWNVTLDYATSGGYAPTQIPDAFTSPANGSTVRTYQSQGGRLTISATETTASGTVAACPNIYYAYIVGAPIPDSEITGRLISLYPKGATPNLLTGIASVESSYQQFANRILYGYSAAWPNESYDGGSHIGLMQVSTTMADAWDWHVNTTDGANLFINEKLPTARRIERKIRKAYHGLPHLTDVQIENMALVLYGPYASPDLSMQYYAPQIVGHKAQWIVNTAGNPNGVNYANSVRSSVK